MRRFVRQATRVLPDRPRAHLVRSMILAENIRKAAHLIAHADHVVALTGAGVSTPSGIPDFRSPESGMWNLFDPATVASIWNFHRYPEDFYEWVRPLVGKLVSARPNPAHAGLAEIEALGHLRSIITQNIDELHQRAGSRRVLEVHGHMREATCVRCFKIIPGGALLARFLEDGQVPRCECGGAIKPNVVLFGEMLPNDVMEEAQKEVEHCDVMLVAGSSLEVEPVASMPDVAARHGARLIVVNYQPTPVDSLAEVVIHADVAKVLPRIADVIRREKNSRPHVG